MISEQLKSIIRDGEGLTPYPKNPVIARFFKEIGRADELGSGVRNLYNYTKIYSGGADPQLLERDVFKIIVPVPQQATQQADKQVDIQELLIEFCKEPKTTSEIMRYLQLKDRENFRSKILKPLLDNGTLHRTIPEKPSSPNQKYYSKHKDPNHV